MPTAIASDAAVRVHRVEVRPLPVAGDPEAARLLRDAAALGLFPADARTAKVYLIEAALSDADLAALRDKLLVDPIVESAALGATPAPAGWALVEVHPLPGVMDPVAQSIRETLRDLFHIDSAVSTGRRYELQGIPQRDARRLAERLLSNAVVAAVHDTPFFPAALPRGTPAAAAVRHVPIRHLSDADLEKLSRDAHLFLDLHEMRAIQAEYRTLNREPTEIELETLAQTWSEHCVHKTLKATITYRGSHEANRHRRTEASSHPEHAGDPIRWAGRPGHTVHPDGTVTIKNLLKSTVAAATFELIAEAKARGEAPFCLSVFEDNAGVIAFDEHTAVCVKVETHNHPSALEPYGGAATGIGGCIRDIIGTGLAAKPIASTDVFCVAMPNEWEGHQGTNASSQTAAGPHVPGHASPVESLPPGCLHPRRVLTDVVAGVRDYGNRMGIPTVNGAVAFDNRYIGNPLVYCGCIGVIPRRNNDALIKGKPNAGDLIVALGGRTGRDGIHGATFSSAELTDTHADEFAHAVQIGNAIEEKRVLDAILRARDFVGGGSAIGHRPSGASNPTTAPAINPSGRSPMPSPLFSALTDCGAGGFSSAVGEMGKDLGATVHLDRAPLKYAGLTSTEIWISEAQERMVLAVPPENLPALQAICDEEHVELAVLGTLGTPNQDLILNHNGVEVGRLPMHFLHEGIPMPTREATWDGSHQGTGHQGTEASRHQAPNQANPTQALTPQTKDPSWLRGSVASSLPDALLALLAHPDIASKHWIIRQYDHEVQGNTVVKPLAGPLGRGPSDAAVIQPVPGSTKALAIANGLATRVGDPDAGGDPYHMALAPIDECVRNLVCTGANPARVAILDNFCWPSCKKPKNLASLVRAAEGCYDAAKAYRTPFISGKDSLNNQFTIPGKDGQPDRTIEIPPTLLISGVGIVDDVHRCVTSDAKQPGHALLLVSGAHGETCRGLANSAYARLVDIANITDERTDAGDPVAHPALVDLERGPAAAHAVAQLIRAGKVHAAHDISDGGLLVALAEMLIAGSTPQRPIGASIGFQGAGPDASELFAEPPSTYLLEVDAPADDDAYEALIAHFENAGVYPEIIGHLTDTGTLTVQTSWSGSFTLPVEALAKAWLAPLDW